MKRVAVSQRVDIWPQRGERRDALDQRLAAWLAACGALAMPVPNQPDLVSAWLACMAPDALVLSGGNDLGEAPERDATEAQMLDWAADRKQPVLGICRGMQMMAVHAGGSLVEVAGHVASRHAVGGAIAAEVNSFHRWGLITLPPGYRCLASAQDGSVEAMEHISLPWEAWMWHPEREAAFDPGSIRRFIDRLETVVPGS